jgi:hypothetical protein
MVSVRPMLAAGALTAAVVVPSVYAHSLAAPANTKPPAVSPVPVVGSELNFLPGTWSSGSPTTYQYEWLRCPRTGGLDDGSNCTNASGVLSHPSPFLLSEDDYGHSLRARETATNTSGSTTVVSAATQTVGHFEGNALGCPSVQAASPIGIDEISPPARLQVERQVAVPVINRNTQRLTLRFTVYACDRQTVRGALVYATPVPYQQFAGPEVTTDNRGIATITLTRQRFFPATPRQQLLVLFVRARKPGEDPLGGISSRRLFSFRVRL